MKKKFEEMIARETDKPHHGRFINIYECNNAHSIITIELARGSTPKFMMCHKCPDPKKKTIFYKPSMMKSKNYPLFAQTKDYKKAAQCEFYRPTYNYWKNMEEGPLKDFIINGGLLVRIKGQKEPMKWV